MFQDLIDRKLVKGNTVGELTIYKYSRKVFYNNLWNTDNRLLDARGMVLDQEGNKVIWPFTKVFNYGENGTTCDLEKEVRVIRKVNGFLASARWYKGEVIVSTTGSLNSDFVKMAKEVLNKLIPLSCTFWQSLKDFTLLFEICHENDPHIVDETPGAYLIGMRDMPSGQMMSESFCDWIAVKGGFFRPEVFTCEFKQVVRMAKEENHEGFMIRDIDTGEHLMKIKTVHYLTKKFIMRMCDNKVDYMYDFAKEFKESLDEEFQTVVDFITQNISKDYWKALTDQERRETVEEFFNGNALFD